MTATQKMAASANSACADNKRSRSSTTPPSLQQKCSNMTLAISANNANRMLEASRALNSSIKNLFDKNISQDAALFDGEKLTTAVREINNGLLSSLLDSMLSDINTGVLSPEEMKLSLLLFFDMDKSSKLFIAFEILSKCERKNEIANGTVTVEKEKKPTVKDCIEFTEEIGNQDECKTTTNTLPNLNRTQMKMLFQSFLTSISACINFNEMKIDDYSHSKSKSFKLEASDSPRNHKQAKASESETVAGNDENKENYASSRIVGKEKQYGVKKEIEEIAKYAADKVFGDITQKQMSNDGKTENTANETAFVGFQHFGEWYNSGGYYLVPWLELLDLAKWDYAGRSIATVELSSTTANLAKVDYSLGNKSPLSPEISNMLLQSPTIPLLSQKKTASSSQVLFSFNFAGATKHQLSITRENLLQLQHLVTITDFSLRSPTQIANVLLRRSKRTRVRNPQPCSSNGTQQYSDEEVMLLSTTDFNNCIRDLIPSETLRRLSSSEVDSLMNHFNFFFLCFGFMNTRNCQNLREGHVNAKELAVGLSFLCNGNKSTKLASTFELIGDPNFAYLSQTGLFSYVRSYLTMLGSVSLLSLSQSSTKNMLKALHSSDKNVASSSFKQKLSETFNTVQYGSRWTLDHFLHSDKKKTESARQGEQLQKSKIYFEDFASWYTNGGFTIAPWLEFLDSRKFMSLLDENEQVKINKFTKQYSQAPTNLPKFRSPKLDTNSQSTVTNEQDVLFTFPLANKQNLVVLREDAAYVRTVVDHLGLLHLFPDDVWKSLHSLVLKKAQNGAKRSIDKWMVVDQKSFVDAVKKVLPSKSKRKRSFTPTLASSPEETLVNFFQSFDLSQIGQVPVNQLMGGLTLLCGGKKSSKLSFAFSLFNVSDESDTKGKTKKTKKKKEDEFKVNLGGKELFYFLRSFLIVMFSCCKQSLVLSADAVGRYISDTANMVTDDVMKYQWRVRRIDRINFVDFGEWYNEGGFETAPWLELLDLKKWVLLDEKTAERLLTKAKPMKNSRLEGHQKDIRNAKSRKTTPNKTPPKSLCPSPPLDHEIDQRIFDDMEIDGIGGDIGDFGFLFPDTNEKDSDLQVVNSLDLVTSTPSPYRTNVKDNRQKALKFQLFTNESNFYTISISPERVLLLKQLVIESNLCNIPISTACKKILGDDIGKQISRDRFNSAIRSMIDKTNNCQTSLQDLFNSIFNAFDFNKLGKADATELACGLTVLCEGRKSDKLEYAFELLDKEKRGLVSRFQMVRYLQSFLLVLLNISSCSLDSTKAQDILFDSNGQEAVGSMALARVICGASSWATEEIFKATPLIKKEIKEGTEHIDFDNFAAWYTKGGYNRIAWLELLDLKKWILSDD